MWLEIFKFPTDSSINTKRYVKNSCRYASKYSETLFLKTLEQFQISTNLTNTFLDGMGKIVIVWHLNKITVC